MMLSTRRALLKSGACARGGGRAAGLPHPHRAKAPSAGARCWWRSSSAARWTGSAWCRRTATRPTRAPAPASRWRPPRRGDAATALDLDGFFALHPALAPLAPLWDGKTLAVVHACGSPDPTRSHFDAQDYMESGTPGVKSTPDGWLGRAAGALPSELRPRHSDPSRSPRGCPAACVATRARSR